MEKKNIGGCGLRTVLIEKYAFTCHVMNPTDTTTGVCSSDSIKNWFVGQKVFYSDRFEAIKLDVSNRSKIVEELILSEVKHKKLA